MAGTFGDAVVHLDSPLHILFKGDTDIHIRGNMLETDLLLTCPVCGHADKDLINSELVLEGDLEKIAKKYNFEYHLVQEHAQHVDLEEIIPTDSTQSEQVENLKKRLEETTNPADIVYIMTLIMKTRVAPLLRDESASGLAQISKINKELRDNAGVVAKLREQMREGDAKKIEQLSAMVSIYRGIMLNLCNTCTTTLTDKIDEAVQETTKIEEAMLAEDSYEAIPDKDLPAIPTPLET